MIAIFSEYSDYSTDLVGKWICNENEAFLRIDEKDEIVSIKIDLFNDEQNIVLVLSNGKAIDFSTISSVFLRRNILHYLSEDVVLIIDNIVIDLKDHLNDEWREISTYIHFYLGNKFHFLGTLNKVNKMITLLMASNLGIVIPDTIVTDRRKGLIGLSTIPKITKSIKDLLCVDQGGFRYCHFL